MDKVCKSFLPTKLDLSKALSSYNSARNNVQVVFFFVTINYCGPKTNRKITILQQSKQYTMDAWYGRYTIVK